MLGSFIMSNVLLFHMHIFMYKYVRVVSSVSGFHTHTFMYIYIYASVSVHRHTFMYIFVILVRCVQCISVLHRYKFMYICQGRVSCPHVQCIHLCVYMSGSCLVYQGFIWIHCRLQYTTASYAYIYVYTYECCREKKYLSGREGTNLCGSRSCG